LLAAAAVLPTKKFSAGIFYSIDKRLASLGNAALGMLSAIVLALLSVIYKLLLEVGFWFAEI